MTLEVCAGYMEARLYSCNALYLHLRLVDKVKCLSSLLIIHKELTRVKRMNTVKAFVVTPS